MKVKKTLLMMSLIFTLLCGSTAYAGDDVWISNMDDAIKQAQKEDKPIFVNFTGSDWCGWCIQLHKHVTSKEEWIKEATAKFVLCEIDKRQAPMPEEETKHVKAMNKKYKIVGWPTLMVLDKNGVPMAKVLTSYKKGIDGVLKAMQGGIDQMKTIQAAQTILKEEKDKAKLTTAAKDFIVAAGSVISFHSETMAKINAMAAEEKDNENGLAEAMSIIELGAKGWPATSNTAEFKELANKLLEMKNIQKDSKKTAYVYLSICQKVDGDKEGALKTIKKAEGLAAVNGTSIENIIEYLNQ